LENDLQNQKYNDMFVSCKINSAVRESENGYWWRPNSWHTKDAAWSYECKLWEQGILKSPEMFSL